MTGAARRRLACALGLFVVLGTQVYGTAGAATTAVGGSAAAAAAIERSATRLSKHLQVLQKRRRVKRAAAAVERAIGRAAAIVAAYPAGRRRAAEHELARVRRGVARARSATRLARRGEDRRARYHARLAKRRLGAPLDALRSLCCRVDVAAPGAASPLVPDSTTPPAPEMCLTGPPTGFRTSGYDVVPVPLEKEPHRRTRPMPLDDPVHPDGSLQYYVDGSEHPHPTALENYALGMAESYRLSGNPEYLRRAVGTAERLLAHSVAYEGGLYLAYTFPFDVFGDPRDHLAAPWFSGMAQGRALLMLRRLLEATGEDHWLRAEDAVYATTFHPRCTGRPWMTFVDDDGYLWIEEYPGAVVPTRVLNGHLSALFGYWERARATADPEAQRLFDGGATTALHYAQELRRPGEYSAYSARTPVQIALYHQVHINQLHTMAVLTKDDAFERLAVAYEADRDAADVQ